MKVNKLKEFFTKIDTDTGMDHRIKNKLLYYDKENIQESRKRHYDRRYRKTFRESSSGRSILRPMLPSLVILVFIAVILFGIRANLFRSASDPEDSMNAARRSAGQYSSNLATESESVVDENGADNSQEQSAVTATTEAVLNQDTTINESSGEKETTDIKDADPLDTLQKEGTNTSVSESNGTASKETEAFQSAESKATGGEFYFAWFDVITVNNVKASIPNLIVRFHGSLDSMDPSDLTDIVLTRDGVPVDNSITFTGKVDQFKWSNEDITDFYFSFATDNREPGNYGLTGKYKGMTFTVYNKIIEAAVSDAAADPDELNSVSFCYLPDEKDKPKQITELAFNFNGLQNAFYQADLAEIKVTCNNEELPVSFEAQVFRYYEANMDNTGDTSFNLVLKEPFTQSGTYTVTGKYQGTAFTSMEIVIP